MALSGFNGYLPHTGQPLGSPVVFGLPFTLLHAALITIFNLSPYGGFMATSILFMAMAAVCCVALIRSFRVSLMIALIFTMIFFSLSFIWGHRSYGQLMFNFALMPAFLLLDRLFLERVYAPDRRWSNVILWGLLSVLARSFCLFMDGYVFVMWAVASGFIFLAYSIQAVRNRQFAAIAVSFTILAVANGLAYVLYGAYVPGGTEYDVMPIDFFRAMSVDLMTLLIPSEVPYPLTWFGLQGRIYEGNLFWGDNSNIAFNYVGYAFLIALVLYLAWLRRGQRFINAALLAGTVAFILSLGPSLKINSQRWDPRPPNSPTLYEDYLMPAEQAVMSLGTEFIYREIPGINNMRGVYRWLLLPKVILVIVGAVVAQHLLNRRKWLLLALFLGVTLFETLPPISRLLTAHASGYRQMSAIDADLVAPLREHILPGDRILFFSSENDFLASYLAPMLDAYAYNVGGDKNELLAFEQWPDGVRAVRWEVYVTEYVTQMLRDDELDWFVIPFFSMRWNSYRWPPTEAEVQQYRDQRTALFNLNDENFAIIESEYFYLIRFNDWLREQLGLS